MPPEQSILTVSSATMKVSSMKISEIFGGDCQNEQEDFDCIVVHFQKIKTFT